MRKLFDENGVLNKNCIANSAKLYRVTKDGVESCVQVFGYPDGYFSVCDMRKDKEDRFGHVEYDHEGAMPNFDGYLTYSTDPYGWAWSLISDWSA